MKFIKFIFLFFPVISFAQGLRGGEMELSITPNQKVDLYLKIYADEGVDSLIIDWGDGASDLLIVGVTAIIPNTDILVSIFGGYHDYDSIGVFEITIRDSFLIDDVINIEDSGNKYLTIKDSVFTHSFINEQISFFSKVNNINFDNGILRHPLMPIKLTDFEFATYELIPFTSEGYSLPIADSLSVTSEGLYWDAPTQVGTYAFAIRANEFRAFVDTIKLTTKTRYMMIDVDSSMLVSSNNLFKIKNTVEIFPNPSSTILNISIESRGGVKNKSTLTLTLTLTNLLGQTLHQIQVPHFEKKWTYQLDVSVYPSGVYFLTLQSGEGILTRKVVVQNN